MAKYTSEIDLSPKHPKAPDFALDKVLRLSGGSILLSIGLRLGWNIYNDTWVTLAKKGTGQFSQDGGLINKNVKGVVFQPQYVTNECTILRVKVPPQIPGQSPLLLTAVGFRGTHTMMDGVQDLMSGGKSFAMPVSPHGGRLIGPMAGLGFYDRFEAHQAHINHALLDNDREASRLGLAHASLYSGHSLGAAVSQIAGVVDAGMQMKAGREGRRKVLVFALSTPFAGDSAFCDMVADYVSHGMLSGACLRVAWDPFPSVGAVTGKAPPLPIICEAPEPSTMKGKGGLHIDRHMAIAGHGIDWFLKQIDPSGGGRRTYAPVFPLHPPFDPS